MSAKLILIGGGARTGKSSFALALARRLGPRRVYVATAEAGDEEMADRIAHHVRERGSDFGTVEEPVEVVEAIRKIEDVDVIVLDCLTFWLANLLLRNIAEEEILWEVRRLADTLREKPHHSIVVTNEVGMGIVPDSPLGRSFRDVCGRSHQLLAPIADEIYFGALGMIIRLKPEPLGAMTSYQEER